jgi:hypothetical protein
LGIVQNKKITLLQKCFQFAELSMLDHLRITVQNHHSRVVTMLGRPLCDQLLWQIVIVIAQPRAHLLTLKLL